MIQIDKHTKEQLITLHKTKSIGLEGNILRLIDTENDEEFKSYIDECINNDKENRRIRLSVTKDVQVKNKELNDWKQENIRLTEELKNEILNVEKSRYEAETAKQNAENDLDLLQKKTQNALISKIVKMALWVIVGVGVITTGVYVFTISMGKDTQVISAAWSNIFGILLTNAFSIIGTIMGIKYASKEE